MTATRKNSILTGRYLEQDPVHGQLPSASTSWVERKEREQERLTDKHTERWGQE